VTRKAVEELQKALPKCKIQAELDGDK
jgi:hypothetical protein